MADSGSGLPMDQHGMAGDSHFRPKTPPATGFQIDEAHVEPARWWLISSAFPMLASTLGPVASAFSLCALVRDWRQHYPPNTDIDNATFERDPPWLRVVNGIQLLVALIANIFLYLNLTRRVRFSIAQPITIVGWYFSFICLVVLFAIVAGPALKGAEQPESEFVWSQAFYYALWAAILYFLDASLMAITFWASLSGRNNKDFNLTDNQRTLMLQTISFLIYLMIGALIFSAIEGWNYLDGLYWADVTLFTIGFGDFAPTTTLARALLFPYAISGIISLGLVITSIRGLILDRGRRYVAARVEERNRRNVLRALVRRGDDQIFTPLQPNPSMNDTLPNDLPPKEFQRRQLEFGLMRAIQQRASTRRRWMAFFGSAISFLILWLVGAVIFHKCEQPYQGWTYFESLYFCYVSLMTIGYGDLTPKSNAGKSFFVFWSLMALPIITILISNSGSTVISIIRGVTVQLGKITILPGNKSFIYEVRRMAKALTCGLVKNVHADGGDIESQERLSEIYTPNSSLGIQTPTAGSSHTVSSPRRASLCNCKNRPALVATQAPNFLSRLHHNLNRIPTDHSFHLLLISEIKAVSQHCRQQTPRRYTYEEWAWYLGLIGEDERDPNRHCRAQATMEHKRTYSQLRRHGKYRPQGTPVDQAPSANNVNEEQRKWSWVGSDNPLLGGKEESEWILESLLGRLEDVLRS